MMKLTLFTLSLSTALFSAVIAPSVASAAEPASCSTVHFAEVSWTDIQATTGTATYILDALGYKTDIKDLDVPIVFQSLANKQLDVFLGNWMPSQAPMIKPYTDAKTIDTVRANLEGAKYTLATNEFGSKLGIKDFSDIAKHEKELDGKIYGIEPGNDGNKLVLDMIKGHKYGLDEKDFKVIESSEQGMLSQVTKLDKSKKPIIFLGWAPHPMNTKYKMTYLTGGDDVFGPNFGGANVFTNTRAGYVAECPNVGKFLQNLSFTLPMENEIMGLIMDKGLQGKAAAKIWLKAHPETIKPWLAGVTTADGGDAEAAVKKSLGL
ncbi:MULTISPECIES: choline ABC transporter substrate-binding protein [Rhizobium]|uniref:Choline ABC transporter substrate-binding protein n=1 Tax=Rhizobium rhododendri TaxID=2506430 RepID=A0ABY8IEC5_9HYPH|nr:MULTISPECIES: choline ABC transporter substrate-binding protein [Rhizobium]MBZ5758734.1 choline ABC transporter substrate-binding protein [Rhizobium sp. VS19-DR96]MBZ5764436.1 choline ABC transporter substrate-binding protein [Rhizobium sp. VS19-DR129.2]MBZ5771979.1 choline ABC transporter substrate-binding protein [Rhizobium sp. VS19-DRK62.2]MBZ5783334.1 choline ABC transporter substrate-binding protein [Rhizobium sp. VS19-DR121]MBZ5800782.1 choline ABC transporter substrate-binding protei